MKVSEYKRLVAHLERVIHVDFHSCVGAEEKAYWVDTAKKVGSDLINATCARASEDLKNRAARVIDQSTTKILDRSFNV